MDLRVLNVITVVISGAVGLSGVAVAVGAVLNTPPAWFTVGFEGVVLLAAAFGVLTGRGRFRGGEGWALLCVAGAVGAGSVLGHLGASGQLLGMSMGPLTGGRLLAAGALATLAAAVVLMRNLRGAGPLLIRGVVLGLPALVIIVGAANGVGASTLAAQPEVVQLLVLLFGGLVVGAMACASVHLTVRAFQVAIDAAPPDSDQR